MTLGINALLLSTGPMGSFTCSEMTYTWDQRLYVVSETRETHSPKLKAKFLHLTNLVAQPGIEPPTT